MKQAIILASGSPRRRELLTQVGITFEVISSDAEETITETDPAKVVEQLSYRKALDVSEQQDRDCLVIGADTVVAAGEQILGKPSNEEEAASMLRQLQGRTHSVYTGVTLVKKEAGERFVQTFHEVTEVDVIPMTEEEILAYIATKEPMDKAGAYGIQGAFAAYIKGITGDYYNVVGLPVCQVVQRMKAL